MKKKFAIINYGVANYNSITGSLKKLGYNYNVTSDKSEIKKSNYIILPGVGTFPSAKKNLIKYDLIKFLKNIIKDGTPTLGICLGMHLLADSSDEINFQKGLSFFQGRVIQNKTNKSHIGWNKLVITKKDSIFKELNNKMFYFQHSYSLIGKKKDIKGFTTFNKKIIPSIISNRNLIGVQFHPEKSQENGLFFFKKFIDWFK